MQKEKEVFPLQFLRRILTLQLHHCCPSPWHTPAHVLCPQTGSCTAMPPKTPPQTRLYHCYQWAQATEQLSD